jgi:hypothetical protein
LQSREFGRIAEHPVLLESPHGGNGLIERRDGDALLAQVVAKLFRRTQSHLHFTPELTRVSAPGPLPARRDATRLRPAFEPAGPGAALPLTGLFTPTLLALALALALTLTLTLALALLPLLTLTLLALLSLSLLPLSLLSLLTLTLLTLLTLLSLLPLLPLLTLTLLTLLSLSLLSLLPFAVGACGGFTPLRHRLHPSHQFARLLHRAFLPAFG